MQTFASRSNASLPAVRRQPSRTAALSSVLFALFPLLGLVACSGPAIDESEPTTLAQDLTQGTFNVAREAGVSASAQSTYPGYAAARAIDGDTNTTVGPQYSWANGHTTTADGRLPQWFEVGLAGLRQVDAVVLYTSSGYELKDYDIQAWDGSAWATVSTRRGNTQTVAEDNFAPVVTDKVRLIAVRGPDVQTFHGRINELEIYGSSTGGGGAGTVESYLRNAGASTATDIGRTEVRDACRARAQGGALGRRVTMTCVYEPGPGFQIFSSELVVLENAFGRGSFSSSILAQNSSIQIAELELQRVNLAIDAALSAGDFAAAGNLEVEYDRRAELYRSYASNNNAFFLEVVANPGALRKSVIDVQGRVTLIKLR